MIFLKNSFEVLKTKTNVSTTPLERLFRIQFDNFLIASISVCTFLKKIDSCASIFEVDQQI